MMFQVLEVLVYSSCQTTSNTGMKVKRLLEKLAEKMSRLSEEKLFYDVYDGPDAREEQAFHTRNSRIPAGHERTIEGAEWAFERKKTFKVRGVVVEPCQLLFDNFSKDPLVGDLITRQYNSLSRHTIEILQNGGVLNFLALRFHHKYSNVGAFKIVENAKLWNAQTILWSYWLPQGKYLDIAKHPDATRQPIYVLTPNFSGCSVVLDELDESTLRVYHVEGGKENQQYNDIPNHGLGQLFYMSYTDYGYYTRNGTTFENITAYAFMQYSVANREWQIHYQRLEHIPTIQIYQNHPDSMFPFFNKPHEITVNLAKGTRVCGTGRYTSLHDSSDAWCTSLRTHINPSHKQSLPCIYTLATQCNTYPISDDTASRTITKTSITNQN